MPLTGLKILDLTRVVSGPFTTMLLADFGADVIKVESRDGDPSRVTGIMGEGENPYFVNLNRNKRGICLDLKAEEGKEIIRRLVRESDILVENFKPGVMERLGLGYDALKEINPRLIYGAVTGFGKGGPYRDRPAFDFIAQAMSGFMSLNGDGSMEPLRAGIPISDTVAGLYLAFGILAAVRNRDRTGKGEEIQVAMVDGLMSMFTFASGALFSTGELPPRNGNDHMVLSPYGVFHASDGPIAVAPSTEKSWLSLTRVLGLTHLVDDPRFSTNKKRLENREEINRIVGEVIAGDSSANWIETLNREGVPCGPINDLRQAFEDPQVLHQEMLLESPQPSGNVKMPGFPVKLVETPAAVRRPSPGMGEHTAEVLKELGYEDDHILRLKADKVV